jgi:hypothetical protein
MLSRNMKHILHSLHFFCNSYGFRDNKTNGICMLRHLIIREPLGWFCHCSSRPLVSDYLRHHGLLPLSLVKSPHLILYELPKSYNVWSAALHTHTYYTADFIILVQWVETSTRKFNSSRLWLQNPHITLQFIHSYKLRPFIDIEIMFVLNMHPMNVKTSGKTMLLCMLRCKVITGN